MAFSESPDNCLETTLNNFPKFSFVWAQELKIRDAEPEPEPPKRFARSRSRSRSRQKRGGSGSEKGYNCGKKKQNESEITRNSQTNSLPKFYINNFRTSAINYLNFS